MTQDDAVTAETPFERSARLWKNAAEAYAYAVAAPSEDVKDAYLQVAWVWSALADESGRPSLMAGQAGKNVAAARPH